jgi:hypothetical protein
MASCRSAPNSNQNHVYLFLDVIFFENAESFFTPPPLPLVHRPPPSLKRSFGRGCSLFNAPQAKKFRACLPTTPLVGSDVLCQKHAILNTPWSEAILYRSVDLGKHLCRPGPTRADQEFWYPCRWGCQPRPTG